MKRISQRCTLLSSIITLIVFWGIKWRSKKNSYEQKYERLRQKSEYDIIDEFFKGKAKRYTENVLQKLQECKNNTKKMFDKILNSRKANEPLFEIGNDTPGNGGQ